MKADFVSWEDAHKKLQKSIVMYKGVPHYVNTGVHVMAEGGVLHLYKLGTYKEVMQPDVIVKYKDENLDISSVPLGYVNFQPECVYVSRTPERRPKQGFNGEVADIKKPVQAGWMTTQAMHDTIMDNFPTLKKAIALLDSCKFSEVAFHRHFSIAGGNIMPVYHRTAIVGQYDRKKEKIVLMSSGSASFIARIMKDLPGVEVEY